MRRSIVLAIVAGLVAGGCGGGDDSGRSGAEQAGRAPQGADPGPIHVHGLGINPKDGALFIATHTGLFRATHGDRVARRVADRWQDTMGFTVVGPDHFLGSGHPDGREKLPPFLGLIRSRDAGESWQEVSLMGKNDFHVLEASGERVYGFGSEFETRTAEFLVSDDGGRSWDEREVPAPLASLAISPDDPDRIVAATEDGLHRSEDGGSGWRALTGDTGLLAWAQSGSLFLVARSGDVSASSDGGRSWDTVGAIGGEPAAFEAAGNDLYAALHDGMIKRSTNGGKSWIVRSRPQSTVAE